MAHTVRSPDEIPESPKPRSSLALVGWAILGTLAGALLAYGVMTWRGSLLTRPGVPVARPPGSIRVWSSLEELKAGHTGPTVVLGAVPSGPGVIGIGSLSGLRGEVAIARGTMWLAYALPNDAVRTEAVTTGGETATFLAIADVPDWQSQSFDAAVPFDALADDLERRASLAGLDPKKTIPLTIDGELSAIKLNIVNGPGMGATPPTDERLAETAIRASVPSAKGTVVGFFASAGDSRLIHAGERIHLHVILPDARQVGHLDAVTVGRGAVLRLPRPLD